ncbi:hypothetical protein GLA29479_2288 [Lysobacter antibioticus]|uniref:Uncharacterized protein n=1 Tax=Lysobacter antibioticus TaxID=84531 RepID=A0A0S2FFZ7_LYSAN|nr:hypothetical protein GLA29479_2288 [Lysobacter antibioticus]ALN82462.1 hypothetical protein LA76x_4352 [Lysobacter antibioticus]
MRVADGHGDSSSARTRRRATTTAEDGCEEAAGRADSRIAAAATPSASQPVALQGRSPDSQAQRRRGVGLPIAAPSRVEHSGGCRDLSCLPLRGQCRTGADPPAREGASPASRFNPAMEKAAGSP